MDITIIADTASIATSQGLGFAIRPNFSTSNHQFSLSDLSSDQSSPSTGVLQISAVIFPVDALAPPPVKSNSFRTTSRTLLRKKRRIRRKSFSAGDSDEGTEGDDGLFSGDGPFFGGGGGSFGGSGGGGWNFDKFGGHNWDESWSSSPSDPAFDFVYEVISWIVLSNCVHFALQKVFRIVADGIGDADREKVPMRLTSVC
ncbi:uncharacterized protein LOC133819418 [Humulus lupulus]|uniref:uncharacterized protein LOC133819418 n=1 Tax=Humulus lupulus TaxID=3486 RepID=UPI002B415D4A|nr:uncharacterized protein LOC133819418 [Humulus lupulus]